MHIGIFHLLGTTPTPNSARIRITIPIENMLGINCFNDLHSQFYP